MRILDSSQKPLGGRVGRITWVCALVGGVVIVGMILFLIARHDGTPGAPPAAAARSSDRVMEPALKPIGRPTRIFDQRATRAGRRGGPTDHAWLDAVVAAESPEQLLAMIKDWEATEAVLVHEELNAQRSKLMYLIPAFTNKQWTAVLSGIENAVSGTGLQSDGAPMPASEMLKELEIYRGKKLITIDEHAAANMPDELRLAALLGEGTISLPANPGREGYQMTGPMVMRLHALGSEQCARYDHLFSYGESD